MPEHEHPENFAELKGIRPSAFPAPRSTTASPVIETTDHRASAGTSSGAQPLDSGGRDGRRVRFLDRFFDLYVMGNMQRRSAMRCGPKALKTPFGEPGGGERCTSLTTGWKRISPRAVGGRREITLADCAAAPALFYADWVEEIGARAAEARKPIARACSPIRCCSRGRRGTALPSLFPLGAPDRD